MANANKQNGNHGWTDIECSREQAKKVIGSIKESRLTPICSTGIPSLDAALGGGIFPGITVLAGTPGAGKSTLGAQVWCNAMRQGIVAIYSDLETGGTPVWAKALCILADGRVRLDQLDDASKLDGEQCDALAEAALFIEDEGFPPFSQDDLDTFYATQNAPEPDEYTRSDVGAIWASLDTDGTVWDSRVGHPVENDNPKDKLAIIDYAQLIRCDAYPKEPTRRLEAAIEDIQEMVSKIPGRCAVLLVSALSRAGYAKPGSLDATFGSSCIEYASEAVVTLADAKPEEVEALGLNGKQREWLKNQQGARVVNCHISKNRHGCQNTVVPLAFEPLRARFKGVRSR